MASHWRAAAAFSLLALLLPVRAMANTQCDSIQFGSANTGLQKGVVAGDKGERAYFHDRGDGCLSEVCRRKAYVVAGDTVLIGGTSTDWAGKWRSNRNSLTIPPQNNGSISVDGLALWGNGPTPNIGEVQGTATPAGTRATVKDGACQGTLTLADDWLIASDNHECGGLNVTFSGVYRR